MTVRRRYVILGLLLIAYLLCSFSLDTQSFWLDEVYAFYFIDHPLRETARLILSPKHNGPLYFALLWGWHQLVGGSDFAIRYFSDLCFVLTGAVLWQLARHWFGERVAGLTALLWAISPNAIWFGQEAKMYALHMLLASLSTLLLIRAARGVAWTRWLAYGVTINLLGYSHFFGGFTIIAQGVLLLATSRRRARLAYLFTMAVMALFYQPVVLFVLRILPHFQLRDNSKGFLPLHYMLQSMAAEYTLRISHLYVEHPLPLWVSLIILLTLGLAEAWRRGWRRGLWVTGLLTLPTLIFYPVSFKIPVFSARYLSASFPIFLLTLALSLAWFRRHSRLLAGGVLLGMVVVAGWSNLRILTNPIYQRSDWRGAANYLSTHVHRDDAIVCFADYVYRALNRYYNGPAPVLPFSSDPYAPEEYYKTELEQKGRHALWLVLHHDQVMAPHHRLREAAAARYPAITAVYPNDGQIAILGYSVHWRHNELPADASPVEARFMNGLELVGYTVDKTRLPPNDVQFFHPPSNWIHIVTYWRRWQPNPSPDFVPYIHLIDTNGGVWGGDLPRAPTVFDFDPPGEWGESIVEAHYDINLNPITPPGVYHLVAGMQRKDGVPIRIEESNTDEVMLRAIEVVRR